MLLISPVWWKELLRAKDWETLSFHTSAHAMPSSICAVSTVLKFSIDSSKTKVNSWIISTRWSTKCFTYTISRLDIQIQFRRNWIFCITFAVVENWFKWHKKKRRDKWKLLSQNRASRRISVWTGKSHNKVKCWNDLFWRSNRFIFISRNVKLIIFGLVESAKSCNLCWMTRVCLMWKS